MRGSPDPVILVSQAFLRRFGNDSGKRLANVVKEVGLEVFYRAADSYEGALLRLKGVPRGFVVINSEIRDAARRSFTLAHELGHFLLPDQIDLPGPCTKEKIENWDENLYHPELDANRFAAEILMPRELVDPYLRIEPSVESARSMAAMCATSLTASVFRLATLTTYRAAVVWCERERAVWYKPSDEFVRWVRLGDISDETFAWECFRGKGVPNQLEPVPATAWLYPKGLMEGAKIWEHSVPMPSYGAVLSLLVMRDPVEIPDDQDLSEQGLDPIEFTIYRKRWPSKR